ncbi:MAG TPA: hypothetical protein V6D28_16225 [Leptolyngbyaceae cyanobacterium]
METTIVNVLALVAFGLLLAVSGGVLYLTIAEWRDRRRQDRDKRARR